jgi:hypothetical protein
MLRALTAEDFEHMVAHKPDIVQIDEELLTAARVQQAHSLGVLLLVKTLDQLGDNMEHWGKLLRNGADLILTDYPRAARKSKLNGCKNEPVCITHCETNGLKCL